MNRFYSIIVFNSVFLTACASVSSTNQPGSDSMKNGAAENNILLHATMLNATHWSLVEIQSMDDSLYTPADPTGYLISFLPQGNFTARLDCNQIRGEWTHSGINQVEINPLISTRALCSPDSLYNRVLSDLDNTRSFVLQNNHLFLATFADGAILEFAPYMPPDFELSPAFACDEAEGTVESMICQDQELIELDLYLDELYQAALNIFPEEELASLVAFQRGWISGRNDCWKNEYIRRCVADEYLIRISELEVKTGHLMVPQAANFLCADEHLLSVYFYSNAVRPLAVLNMNQQQFFTWLTPSASGSRYMGQNITFWQKGNEAMLTTLETEQNCQQQFSRL